MIPSLRQWFDVFTIYGIVGLIALHGIAAVVQGNALWSAVVLVLLGSGIFFVAAHSLLWGIVIAFLEIMIGGHGQLIDAHVGTTVIGLRLVIFLAVMLGVIYHIALKKVYPTFVFERDAPIFLLCFAVMIGALIGVNANGFSGAFDDANSYVTLLYLVPISMIPWTMDAKQRLLWTLALGATWTVGFSLILVYAFHHFDANNIWTLYRVVRDARLAEVTLLSSPDYIVQTLGDAPWFFRVFEPAQAFVVFFTLLLIAMMMFVVKSGRELLIVSLVLSPFLAVIIGGQSRSFYLGFAIGILAIAFASILRRERLRHIVCVGGAGIFSCAVAGGLLWTLMAIPAPPRPDISDSPYYKGQNDDTRVLAVSSRWNLLGPMMSEISHSPILGSGFGKTVTFISDDPRVREQNASGEWTTYRFEWGFHDIWLKMGILGVVAILWILFIQIRAVGRVLYDKQSSAWIVIGLVSGTIALYVTHGFSPYLNHPIGLGFILLVLPFLPWNQIHIPEVAMKNSMTTIAVPRIKKPITVREQ